ncbi:MAG TPA: hypothetical protein VFG04_25330 [Planctomycetaceae bacterium]|nr:hypothetical protein [Planctomycetaceae bacterium]
MRLAIRGLAPLLLVAFLFVEGAASRASSPVLRLPSPRQPHSVLSPKSGVPKSSITPPTTKGGKKKSWFPFGNRNKKAFSR